MLAFLAEHTIAVIFGLISAGLLAACKYFYSKNKAKYFKNSNIV